MNFSNFRRILVVFSEKAIFFRQIFGWMARESRHVKITNLPADANVVQIREFFSKDFGRIQKVEPLADECDEDQQCIVVSFMDIKTASRAIEAITGGGGDLEWADGRQLKAFYYEPKGSGAPQILEISDSKLRRWKISPPTNEIVLLSIILSIILIILFVVPWLNCYQLYYRGPNHPIRLWFWGDLGVHFPIIRFVYGFEAI